MSDAGLRFWLDHVTTEGGLWEPAGDSTTVVLPAELAARYRLAEDLTVTDDPESPARTASPSSVRDIRC